jgi:hypothetical protein
MGGRSFDEEGGVWIVTGWVLCLLVYALVVLMDVAGFTAVLPLVVLPPVVIGLIGANSLLGGGRHYGRRATSAVTGDPAPLPSSGPNGARSAGTNGARSGTVLSAEQPPPPEEPPGPS